jgi:hypothetical protein
VPGSPYTVSSVRRLTMLLLPLAVAGLALPVLAEAHTGPLLTAATPVAFGTSLRAAAPARSVLWIVVGVAAGVVLAAVARRRPRRALGLALAVLLALFAVEAGIHSVHHLGDRAAVACAVAAAAGHLALSLDDGVPILQVPRVTPAAVAEAAAARPATPSRGPDPARAPPAPIA